MLLIKVIESRLVYRAIVYSALVLTVSCTRIRNGFIEEGAPVVINLDSSARHYSLASLVDSVRAISLETNNNSIISDPVFVKQIIYKNNRYFVFDDKFYAIKVFDSEGKYLYDLCRLGLGKGESLHIEDIEFDCSRNLVMVLSNRPMKILEFSLDGHLAKEQTLNFFASGFAFPSVDRRIFYINQNRSEVSSNKNILLTDSNNVVKSRMFDFPKNIHATSYFSGGLYSTGQGIFFNPVFSDTFYRMTGDTAKPAYKTNYSSRNIPPGTPEIEIDKNLKHFSFQYTTFATYRDYIGFNYFGGIRSAAFFNTRSGRTVTSDILSDSLNILFSNSMFENDGKLVMVLDLNSLAGFLQRNAKAIQQRFPAIYKHIHVPNAKQNPLLLEFVLKEI
ncbi:MAG TPA: 6-bladed beta-propeller [Puia sp.]|nr:6-bladed beta-propeller [Puia sp.]